MRRRQFVAGASAGVLATACSGGPEGNEPGRAANKAGRGTPAPGQYSEAPMLAELVESGDLDPLDERLPKEPMVVQPGMLVGDDVLTLEIGQFGGTLQLAQESPDGDPIIFIGLNEPLLWAPSGFDYEGGIVGNVVRDWEANADSSAFTFYMREGLRWSDGQPVTIEDVKFCFEDVLFDEEATPVFPLYLRRGLNIDAPPVEFAVVDDWTFTLSFDQPYGTFPAQLAIAEWKGYGDIIKPRHYLEQFHKKYASAGDLKQLLEEESLAEDQWGSLFDTKQLTGWMWDATNEVGLGHPTLMPWVLTEVGTGVFRFERNPYYFKIDVEGNQLPYLDGIRSQIVQDKETLTSRALFGEFDYLGERATFRQMPVMAERAEEGKVTLFAPKQHVLPTTVYLNLTHLDEVWREVVHDLRFRQALAFATNYEELADTFYLGEFAKPPTESNPGKYDKAEAERLLDEMGLDSKDNDGFRLGPDGSRFTIPFEVADLTENHIPVAELMAEYWNEVGVHTTVKPIDATLRGERAEANELKASIVWTHFPLWASAGWDDYLPGTNWGPLWHHWYEQRTDVGTEEPPADVKELFGLHEELMASTAGTEETVAAAAEIAKHHRDNVWCIQLFEDAHWPTFFSTRVRNVPTGVPSDMLGIIATYSMESWYVTEE